MEGLAGKGFRVTLIGIIRAGPGGAGRLLEQFIAYAEAVGVHTVTTPLALQ